MNRLLSIGFEFAGHWHLDDGTLRVAFRQHAEQRNVLYAFVSEGDVKYVGKSTQTLRKRMAGYAFPAPDSGTNRKNHRNIRELLAAGASVDVYALPDNGLMHYGQFHLNLAAGLEDSIINKLRPEWNGRPERQSETQRVEDGDDAALDTEASEEAMASGTPSTISEIPVTASDPLAPLATFEFTLQLTYWSQGFFNTGVAPSESFGADGDTIEIFFGDATSPILGTINRRSNNNGTPRIFGGSALRKMFQTQPVRAVMGVEVNSPTSIRIHPKVA